MRNRQAQFSVGQVVQHKLFHYRGVIVDVDPHYLHTDTWYELMAKTKPPKDKPWYHILVDNADYTTYVAEQNLELDIVEAPISHPDLQEYFLETKNGHYVSKKRTH